MKYKVVPFFASVSSLEGSREAAEQLEKLVQEWSDHGWEYVRMESVDTYIAGNNGCFGIGSTAPVMTSYSMVVFRQ